MIYKNSGKLFFNQLPIEYEKIKHDKRFQEYYESHKFNPFEISNKYYNAKKKKYFNIYKDTLPDFFDTKENY